MNHPNLNQERQQDILTNGTRERLIAWLEWNDHNGIYSDRDMLSEGAQPLTLEQLRELMTGQIDQVN